MSRVHFLNEELQKFILSLDDQTQAKVLHHIELLETFGHKLGPPYTKKIGKDLFELRLRGKMKIRIFYTFYKHSIILLSGFVKKSQRLPKKEITKAKKYLDQLDKS